MQAGRCWRFVGSASKPLGKGLIVFPTSPPRGSNGAELCEPEFYWKRQRGLNPPTLESECVNCGASARLQNLSLHL